MPPSTTRILLRFLGSMNLAITLLVAIAIAAVIGTVVQQNQPYPDYVLKFGPFWFQLFQQLDLFNVYGSAWFLTILGFLVVSTTVCVSRNTPHMLREMRDYRENSPRTALQGLPHHAHINSPRPAEAVMPALQALLRQHGYAVKSQPQASGWRLAAKTGSGGRLGYLFSHVAIVVICIGGLIDGNLPLKWAQWRGQIAVETRRIPAADIPAISTLASDNASFRANVDIAEGSQANLAFIDYQDGYLLQKLPFTIQVDDFRIAHYPSGQPKSFESDLTLIDPESPQAIKQTLSVNHPLRYKGYAIYQNSFGDGGSQLQLRAWSLTGTQTTRTLQATVKQHTVIADKTLEVSDFRPFNVNPDPSGTKQFINIGPSFQFKLRDATGTANEYISYMQPVQQADGLFYLSGKRAKVSEPFQYWYIPVDADKRLDGFMAFYQALHTPAFIQQVAKNAADAAPSSQHSTPQARQAVADFMTALLNQFVAGGYEQVAAGIEQTVEPERRQAVADIYATVLQQLLQQAYQQLRPTPSSGDDAAFTDWFFKHAVEAINAAHFYDAPVFLELERFKHVEATGLQITRSPGSWLVFPGCLLLVLGVFCMFYMPQRRLWLLLEPDATGCLITLAGSAQRNRYDFDRSFEQIQQQIRHITAITE